MKKTFSGIVVSTKQQNTAVVEITRHVPHPLYQKLLKKSKKFQVDTNGKTISAGDTVLIAETRPMSKTKNFVVVEVRKK